MNAAWSRSQFLVSILIGVSSYACAVAQPVTPPRDTFRSPVESTPGMIFVVPEEKINWSRAKDLIYDPDPTVRSGAAHALAGSDGSGSIPTLHKLLIDDPNIKVRMNAARALGSIGRPEIEPSLVEAAGQKSPLAVRYEAYRALASINTDSSLGVLYSSLKDPNLYIRAAGLEALGRRGDSRAVAEVTTMVTDHDPRVAGRAIWALGEIRDPGSVPVIVDTLTKSSLSDIRRESAIALGRIGDVKALKALVSTAANTKEDLAVRLTALNSTIRIRPTSMVPPELFVLTQDRHADVRAAAVHAIGVIHKGESADVILTALKDPEPRVRMSAVTAMGLSPAVFGKALSEVSLDRFAFAELRIKALTALSNLGADDLNRTGAAARFTPLLSTQEPIDVQLAAVNFFAILGSPTAMDAVRKFGNEKDLAPELKASIARTIQ